MVAVVTLAVGAVSTTVVVVVDSSSVIKPHEMMVRLKHETRIMFKIFFILYSKVNVKEIADSIIDFYLNNREEEFHQNTKEEKKRFTWKKLVEGAETLIGKQLK